MNRKQLLVSMLASTACALIFAAVPALTQGPIGGGGSVTCSNCSGSGASAVDASAFTAAVSAFAPGGGFYQTTATANALTSGQQGMYQLTINRAVHTNLRNASGVEVTSWPVTNTGVFAVQAAATQSGGWTVTANAGTNLNTSSLALESTATNGNHKTQIVDGAGNVVGSTTNALDVNIKSGGGSGGTSSTFGAAFPATGTAAGMSQGGNMVALTGTTGNLNVQCANCSGSGVSTVDEAAFTAATSIFAGTGGFFQTTATNNPLTNGQQGMLQLTAQRAAFANLRNASGTEVGTSAAEIFVGGRGTAGTAAGGVLTVQGAASMTKLLVTPDSVALPANQSVNVAQLAGTTTDTNSGTKSAGTLRVVLATDQPALTNKLLVTPDSVALPANQSVNVAQINGVTTLMGNGATGTGSQRVTLSNDNTIPTGWPSAANQTSWNVAEGSAPPANSVSLGANFSGATGGLQARIIGCDGTAIYDASTNGSTELKALTSGRAIYVCGYTIIASGTVNVKLIYGTGTACATGSNNMTPAYQLTAQNGAVDGAPFYRGMKTASANALCINTSAGVAVQAIVYYSVL